MKNAVVLFLFGLLGLINACSVIENQTVQHEKLQGVWYEKLALGDNLKVFFDKCMKDELTIASNGEITKIRSYLWKWFPWITWNSKSTLNDKGTKWEITESGILGLGHTTKDMCILAMDSDFVVIKTCPNSWYAADERVWVYWKTNAEIGMDQLAQVQSAFDALKLSYKVEDFKKVSQSNC